MQLSQTGHNFLPSPSMLLRQKEPCMYSILLHQRGQNGPFSCGAVRPHLSHHSITQHPTIANPTAYQTAGLSHLHGGGSLCQTEPCCRCCTKLECQTARHDSDKCPSCLPGPFRSLDSGEAVGTGLNGESNQGLFYGIHMPLLTPGTIVSGSGNGASCRSQHFRSRTFWLGRGKARQPRQQPGNQAVKAGCSQVNPFANPISVSSVSWFKFMK